MQWKTWGNPTVKALNDIMRTRNGIVYTAFKKGNMYTLEAGPDGDITLTSHDNAGIAFCMVAKTNGEFLKEFNDNFEIVEDNKEE